jgi:hypothetical protein
MAVKNIEWFKVADSKKGILWQQNNLTTADAGDKKITLAKVGNDVLACAINVHMREAYLPTDLLMQQEI